MRDLKACVACLSNDVKLLDLDGIGLRRDFNILLGLHTERGNGLPNYLCLECNARVTGFTKFRAKCRQAYFTLIEILERNKLIVLDDIKMIDRKTAGLLSTLSNWSTERTHYEFVKSEETQNNQNKPVKSEISDQPLYNLTSKNRQGLWHVPLKNESIPKWNSSEIKLELRELVSSSRYKDTNIQIEEYNYERGNLNTSLNSDITMIEDQVYIVCSDVDEILSGDMENNGTKETKPHKTNLDEVYPSVLSLRTKIQSVENTIAVDPDSDQLFSDDSSNDATNEGEPNNSNLDEEYARLVLLTTKEQAAAVEICKIFSIKKYKCEICGKSYNTEKDLKLHKRMHDKHEKGYFECELCNYYYRTEFLLQTHMAEKHLYKYICKKCPEVNFDRLTAKKHFLMTHLKYSSTSAQQTKSRPSWLKKRSARKSKAINTGPKKLVKEVPEDYFITVNVDQLEQYEIIKERRNSTNYLKSQFKCELCYKGFRNSTTYEKHLKKHDPEVSGKLICDMCKLCYADAQTMYNHVKTLHLYKYCCQMCTYVCYGGHHAKEHYKWHKNVEYECPHCEKKFSKTSSRLTHIRIAHPSTKLCSICGHSFISDMGLSYHVKKNHTKEEIETSEKHKILATADNKLYCDECKVVFISDKAFQTHLGSSSKHTMVNKSAKVRIPHWTKKTCEQTVRTEIVNQGRVIASTCDECGEALPNDVQARKHYKSNHPGVAYLRRYMCDICGHTTNQYANLQAHFLRKHTDEKPHACPVCDRRFGMAASRDRHLRTHTSEKRYECKHCHRRFAQNSGLKKHIQAVHMKTPSKKSRKRSKGAEVPLLQQELSNVPQAQTNYLNAQMA